jgi:type VI secretion system secreted protein Hcp
VSKQRNTLKKLSGTNRRVAIGLIVAVTMIGAAALSGAVGAKPASSSSTSVQLPAGSELGNRIWIEDVTDRGEWIEVLSFSWGLSQTGTSGSGGGGGAGKASFQDLHFTTRLSQFSPSIALYVAQGKHIKTIILEDFSTATKKNNETVYLEIKLSDCLISSYQISGQSGGDSLPMESISLNYAKIEFSYNPKNETGAGRPASMGWDLAENKKV